MDGNQRVLSKAQPSRTPPADSIEPRHNEAGWVRKRQAMSVTQPKVAIRASATIHQMKGREKFGVWRSILAAILVGQPVSAAIQPNHTSAPPTENAMTANQSRELPWPRRKVGKASAPSAAA